MPGMRDRFVTTAVRLLDRDPRTAVVLADIGVDRFREAGAFERHPHRVINVGIREQLLIGVAAGLALEGFRPIAHTYAPFLVERPFEQLKLDLSHQGASAILVSVGGSWDASSSGRTHQAPGDVALLATLPDWEIHVPGHPDEVEALLEAAMASPRNVYLRLSEDRNRERHLVDAERIAAVRRGAPGAPAAIAVGPMLDAVLEATAGLDLTVLYAATVRPLDRGSLREHVRGPAAILVEPTLQGTSTAALAEVLDDRPLRLLSLGVPPVELRRYGSPAEHRAAHGLDPAGLRTRIRDFLDAA
jgi:transketolase